MDLDFIMVLVVYVGSMMKKIILYDGYTTSVYAYTNNASYTPKSIFILHNNDNNSGTYITVLFNYDKIINKKIGLMYHFQMLNL